MRLGRALEEVQCGQAGDDPTMLIPRVLAPLLTTINYNQDLF